MSMAPAWLLKTSGCRSRCVKSWPVVTGHVKVLLKSYERPERTVGAGKEVRRAARAAVAVLEANGLDCCLFGSAACAIYGMENREPNDVDIIVLSTMDREAIKELLESNDHRFYLVPSANPSNTYCVLWFTLRRERACKVDILTPGVLSIPNIPVQRILYQDKFPDIPITPFLCLLLLKLRGWVDHREDSRQYMRDKVPMDEGDIEELLDLAVEHEVHLRKERWMPKWFVEEARERIAEYVQVFPYSASDWREIGLGNVLRS